MLFQCMSPFLDTCPWCKSDILYTKLHCVSTALYGREKNTDYVQEHSTVDNMWSKREKVLEEGKNYTMRSILISLSPNQVEMGYIQHAWRKQIHMIFWMVSMAYIGQYMRIQVILKWLLDKLIFMAWLKWLKTGYNDTLLWTWWWASQFWKDREILDKLSN